MPNKTKKPEQKRKRNKPIWLVGVAVLLLAVGVAAIIEFVGTGGDDPPSDPPPPPYVEVIHLNFYFPVIGDGGDWEYETRQITQTNQSYTLSYVVSSLFSGPERLDLEQVSPQWLSVELIHFNQEEGVVSLFFPASFEEMSARRRINLIVSMVYTLTGLDFVEGLLFYVNDEPMLDADGEIFGLRNRENTMLDVIGPPPTVIVLYFPDEQMEWLVRELRNITYDPLVGIESRIVDALIEGPRMSGLSGVLPPETMLHSPVDRSGDIVFVDFTSDFLTNFTGGSTAEEMMIFSIVNSLTEIEENTYVQILVDGLSVHYDAFHMDASRPIERDESLIFRAE
ncbi:MAG: GerMN domain-containing protein [Defluviitaleaceae bacterium]|nr:GerMN domain-containing protein [Defluviitaleaceae bacterium]